MLEKQGDFVVCRKHPVFGGYADAFKTGNDRRAVKGDENIVERVVGIIVIGDGLVGKANEYIVLFQFVFSRRSDEFSRAF